jgi:RNA polymerase sigma factor for flagellar operon FliA
VKRLTRRQEALVVENLDLVDPIARGVGRMLAVSVELDDMIQAGRIGLMQAARRFDPGAGVPFRVYAKSRVRGAIIDTFRRRNYHYELHAEIRDDTPTAGPSVEEELDREKAGGDGL